MASPKVFLSYRRDDATHQVGRIYDHLATLFGRANVFKDVDSIPAGADFRRVLEDAVSACDVLLVVIGDQWLTLADKHGKQRVDNASDFVRIEVEAALGRGLPVIPVLVGTASMPPADSLPEGIRALSFRHAVQVRPDPDFRQDVLKLAAGVQNAAQLSPRAFESLRMGRRQARWVAAFCAVVAAFAVAVAVLFANREPNNFPPPQTKPDFEVITLDWPHVGPRQYLEMEIAQRVAKEVLFEETVFQTVEGKRAEEKRTAKKIIYDTAMELMPIRADYNLRVYKPNRPDIPYVIVLSGGEPNSFSWLLSSARPVLRPTDIIGVPIDKIPPPVKAPG